MTGEVKPPRAHPSPKPTLAGLVKRVHELAENSEAIGFDHPHCQARMVQRGVTMRMVLETLRKGEGMSGPALDRYGDWRIKLKRSVAGRRVQVVVAIGEKDCTVVTVI